MSEATSIGPESSAVQMHLQILQGVIQRMAENSRSCKVWCVTLVSAVLVLVARTGEANHALIALAPAILFLVLDSYYLGLERAFRSSYTSFVSKIHGESVSTDDLYSVNASGSIPRHFFWALFRSFSILPFYLMVMATVIITWLLVF